MKEFEVTNRLAELQLQWLRENYSEDQLQAALQKIRGRKPFPYNVAKILQREGGPKMPSADELLARDPETVAAAERVKKQALEKLREIRSSFRRQAE